VKLRLAALALVGAAAAAAIGVARATSRPPARVQVTATEFELALSRPTLRSGRTIVQLLNLGEDPHDLRLQRVGGTRVYRLPVVLPGKYANLSLRTLPGRYRLWCSIADHRQLGMRATLVVRGR
jgi:plastocyanin